MLPIKKCKKCDYIFKSKKFGHRISCPRCSSRLVVDANKTDLAYYEKMNKNK